MPQIDLFPLGLATGSRFCNREIERSTLKHNIDICKHTAIISPRRYGKSSLAHQVIFDAKLKFATIDLFVAYDEKLVCERIVTGVSQLVSQLMPFSKRALKLVETCFKNARAIVKTGRIALEISFSRPTFSPVSEILETLEGLDKLAKQQQQKIVIFFDEFQDLSLADNSKAIQGAIRNIAQKTTNIAFVFSGSSRNMLQKMFDDKTKPLYMLCKKIFLERIEAIHYINYIQSAAKITWHKKLPKEFIDKIMELTERHPFYVNLLCSELWTRKIPNTSDQIKEAWETCFNEELRRIESELLPLNANQIKTLRTIANFGEVNAPTGFEFLQATKLPLGSVQRSLAYLFDHDYIYKTKSGAIRIIDPFIKMALLDHYR